VSGFITLNRLAAEIGMDRTALRRKALRLGCKPLPVLAPGTRGQPSLAITHEEADRIRKTKRSPPSQGMFGIPGSVMTTSLSFDYDSLYRSAKHRAEELERELTDLRGLIHFLEPLTAGCVGVGEGEGSLVERERPYRGMHSTDAALHYLIGVAGKSCTTREVADALKAGGYESGSPNFVINTYTSLKRLRKRGAVEQVGKGIWQANKA
jgi:hypothetical protein